MRCKGRPRRRFSLRPMAQFDAEFIQPGNSLTDSVKHTGTKPAGEYRPMKFCDILDAQFGQHSCKKTRLYQANSNH